MSANRRDIMLGLGMGTAAVLGAGQTGASETGAPPALSVAGFGAVADADGDQGEALQRAITEAGSRGVPLVIPGGVYRTRQTLRMTSSLHIIAAPGAQLIGEHPLGVLSAPENQHVIIENLALSSAALSPGKSLLECNGGQLVLARCAFSAASGGGFVANGSSLSVRDCSAFGLGGVAFTGAGGSGAAFHGNTIAACAGGIALSAPARAAICANSINRSAGTALAIADIGESATISANMISGCATGISLSAGREFKARLYIHDNMIDDASMGITVDLEQETYAAIATNIITRTRAGAIRGMHEGRATSNDLAVESAEAFLNLAIFGNLTR